MKPLTYCRKVVKKSQSNFFFCLLFLTKTQQNAIMALYAFCREVDNIVDDCMEQQEAEEGLNFWEKEVNRLYHGTPQHPISLALQPFTEAYQWPQGLFEEMIVGMRMDLNHQGYANFEALNQYCYRVASVVGLLACRIFGYQDSGTLVYAEKLGLALQLINILRDVKEDALRNRVYLPKDILTRHQLTPEDILQQKYSHTALQGVLEETTSYAKDTFDQALKALPECDRLSQLPGLIMGNIYYHLLTKIEKKAKSPTMLFDTPIRLSRLTKLHIALKTQHTEKKRAKQKLVSNKHKKTNKTTLTF